MTNTKFHPIKKCSCVACKAGRSSTWGNKTLVAAERAFRHNWVAEEKNILTTDWDNYALNPVGAGYTD